eukprot:Hpha_TRINITY_DN15726_c2_g3::TRINITY_DN15726_c2_g3_i1::g.40247::m.40247
MTSRHRMTYTGVGERKLGGRKVCPPLCFCGGVGGSPGSKKHLLNVPVVGAAATAQNVESEGLAQLSHQTSKLFFVPRVELGRLVKLGVALCRGVGLHAAHPPQPHGFLPLLRVVECGAEVGGVTTVDHEVRRVPPRRLVNLLDRLLQGVTIGELTVGLGGKGDHHGQTQLLRGPSHTDTLGGVGACDKGHLVNPCGVLECLQLRSVVRLRLLGVHLRRRGVCVVARTDVTRDEDAQVGGGGTEIVKDLHGLLVELRHALRRVLLLRNLVRPALARTPCARVQNQVLVAVALAEVNVRLVVFLQCLCVLL